MTSLLEMLRGPLVCHPGRLTGQGVLLSWTTSNVQWRQGWQRVEADLGPTVAVELSRGTRSVEGRGLLGRLLSSRPEHCLQVEVQAGGHRLTLAGRVEEDRLRGLPVRHQDGQEVDGGDLVALVVAFAAAGAQVQGQRWVEAPPRPAEPPPAVEPSSDEAQPAAADAPADVAPEPAEPASPSTVDEPDGAAEAAAEEPMLPSAEADSEVESAPPPPDEGDGEAERAEPPPEALAPVEEDAASAPTEAAPDAPAEEPRIEEPPAAPSADEQAAAGVGGVEDEEEEEVEAAAGASVPDREEAAPRPRWAPGTVVEEAGLSWVVVPAGRFTRGSPEDEPGRNEWEDQEEARITSPLLLARTPVTRARWREVMGFDPSQAGGEGLEHPVDSVTWFEAALLCNALSRRAGLEEVYAFSPAPPTPGDASWRPAVATRPDASGYRLPTSSEWEWACRAGTTGMTWAGSFTEAEAEARLAPLAWFAANAPDGTRPVGGRAANPWGLLDMLGNVREWCQDGDPTREGCVARGGSWRAAALECRAAEWDSYQAWERRADFGVRVARALTPDAVADAAGGQDDA